MSEAHKLIAQNPNRSQFHLIEKVEAGMVLTGTEIKSMRATSPNLRDAFVEIRKRGGSLEAWLLNAHIGPYTHGNIYNHESLRPRKLLLHRHQIERIHGGLVKEGMTAIPTQLYLVKGRAKIEIALAKGKNKEDRRQDIKKRTADREIAAVMKKTNRAPAPTRKISKWEDD